MKNCPHCKPMKPLRDVLWEEYLRARYAYTENPCETTSVALKMTLAVWRQACIESSRLRP